MVEKVLGVWQVFYAWASAQPVFIQVALGIVLVVVGGYLLLMLFNILLITIFRE